MATGTKKISKSITLAPGEQFTLPPNATIVGVVGEVDSTCEIPTLEDLTCYLFVIAIGDHDNSDTILWDSKDFRVKGWRYDGVDYDNIRVGTTGDAGALPQDISTTLAKEAEKDGIFMTDVKFGYNSAEGDNGTHNFIVFSTIPSVAAKLELKVDTGASYITGDNFVPAAYLKPLLYSTTSGLRNVPACGQQS